MRLTQDSETNTLCRNDMENAGILIKSHLKLVLT